MITISESGIFFISTTLKTICTIMCIVIIKVVFLHLCLTPSIETAIGIWLVGSDITACPFRAGGQTEVNHVWMMVVGTMIRHL